ncbi:hypothetical protein DM02DRAFT_673349 [Periconia macrospinosa]|uniref:Tyrosine specific protein phosphatases domain-containing protein n=1 Tax=Periconia macrospinosa TaxID=97972 RepID=A0A2V1DMK6_9PLEO|nr:hypothetical protein DM02DRAFT_673349 [Periconia macrospinosa]
MEPHYSSPSPSAVHNGTFRFPQAIVRLLRNPFPGSIHPPQSHPDSDLTDLSIFHLINNCARLLLRLVNPFASHNLALHPLSVGMVKTAALCGIGSLAFWLWKNQRVPKGEKQAPADAASPAPDDALEAASTDPGLLKKYSTTREYTVPRTGFTYPGIRTFYRPHPQESKLPQKPEPVPLLVFIHGLGGSAAQFHSILISLSNNAPCLAIDLPGCGLSSFQPKAWEAYTTEALVQLLTVVIEAHRDQDRGQRVILVAHSMGCSLAAMLASSTSPYRGLLSAHVAGVVALCPQAEPPSADKVRQLKRVTSMPTAIFEMFRMWDRRGGPNSASVLRMTGEGADEDTKKLQMRFNRQSRTPVWMRMARGMLPDSSSGTPRGGLPGREVWAGIDVPLFLAAGECDHVTPVDNVRRIVHFLGRDTAAIEPPSTRASLPIAAAPFDPSTVDPQLDERKHQDSGVDANDLPDVAAHDAPIPASSTASTHESSTDIDSSSADASTALTDGTPESTAPQPCPRRLVVKTAIMPAPAAHSLIFSPSTARIISGLIGTFLSDHIDPRLSLAWQLQYLSTEGKWDVKNLRKWAAVKPVSEPIGNTFRALKTLREVDPSHSPKIFVREWAGKLRAVVDISHDAPVYDPKGLEDGGIPYHKFPTVSKQPPTKEEVERFIDLIDGIRASPSSPLPPPSPNQNQPSPSPQLIGVHCHYGFNRTGFFVVSYLIERRGFTVQDAIDEFEKKRPPGIRHQHFVDALFVRYSKGLGRAPTL